MGFNTQKIEEIFGKKLGSLNTYSKGQTFENKLPLSFLGKEVKASNIGINNDTINSIIFSIDAKKHSDILSKLLELYGSPKVAFEANLFPSHNNNEKEGTFSSGIASSKDFKFDKAKLNEYIYIVWDIENFMLNYYKPKSVMNESLDIRIEMINKGF